MKNKVLVLATLIAVMGTLQLKAQLNVGSTSAPITTLDVQGKAYVRDSLGIGTSTPGTQLDVVGNVNGNVGARVYNISSGASATSILSFGVDVSANGAYIYHTGSGNTGLGSRAFVFGNGSITGPFVWSQGGFERMRIASTGQVGIGTTTPAATLHVVGTALISSLPSGATTDSVVTSDASGNLHRRTATSVGGAADLRIVTGGAFNNHITSDAGIGSNGTSVGTGSANVAIGTSSMSQNTTGANNVGVGINSLGQNTSGVNNIGVGPGSLGQNKQGTDNVAIGNNALYSNAGTGANGSVAIGSSALYSNNGAFGLHVGIGLNALFSNTSGYANIGIGYSALSANTVGNFNTVMGTQALAGIAPGDQNIAVGYQAGYYLSGAHNTAMGTQALEGTSITAMSGTYNTAVGDQAGLLVSTGSNNTLVGPSAGSTLTTGGSNIAIGKNAQVQTATVSNQMSIGNIIYGSNLNGGTPTGNVSIGTGYYPNNGGITLDVNGTTRIVGAVAMSINTSSATGAYTLVAADIAKSVYRITTAIATLTLPPGTAGQFDGQVLIIANSTGASVSVATTNTYEGGALTLVAVGAVGVHSTQYVWMGAGNAWARLQ